MAGFLVGARVAETRSREAAAEASTDNTNFQAELLSLPLLSKEENMFIGICGGTSSHFQAIANDSTNALLQESALASPQSPTF